MDLSTFINGSVGQGRCDDCDNQVEILYPWKYEPSIKLCDDCYDERMKEEEQNEF